jgi:hypothetical protein
MRKILFAILYLIFVGVAQASDSILFDWNDGEAQNSWGTTVQTLGDVSGDGIADVALAVGEELHVFFGGPSADAIADLVIGPPMGPSSGYAIKGPIDLNGDGSPDLIVNARGASRVGPIYCYWGGGQLDDTPDFIYPGTWSADSVCRAGNFIPTDGVDDLAVGVSSSTYDYVRVYEGGLPPLEQYSWMRIEYTAFTGWATGFRYAGDFNGDSFSDIVTRAPWATSTCIDMGFPNSCPGGGQLYIYQGGPDRLRGAAVVQGNESDGQLGYGLAADCDLNADGYDDLLATKPWEDVTWVIFGRPELPISIYGPDLVIPGGKGVAALGDMSGDQIDDFATVDASGVLWIHFGGSGIDQVAEGSIILPEEDMRELVRVVRVNDFDGDGFNDIGVGIRETITYNQWIMSSRIYSGFKELEIPTMDRSVGGLKSLYRRR